MNENNILKNLIFLALVFFSGSVLAQDWTYMTHDSLSFKISSPEPLVEDVKDALTELGTMRVNSFGFIPKKGGNLLYQVIVINYPSSSFPEDSIELKQAVLHDLITQSAELPENEILYQEDILRWNISGVQWRIHSGEQISIKSQAFVYRDKIYIVQVMSNKLQSLNDDINRFIDSFEISKG